jgi:hypothetical protein
VLKEPMGGANGASHVFSDDAAPDSAPLQLATLG